MSTDKHTRALTQLEDALRSLQLASDLIAEQEGDYSLPFENDVEWLASEVRRVYAAVKEGHFK
jgi:hypothetical protein